MTENQNTDPAIRSLQTSIIGYIEDYTTGDLKGLDFSMDNACSAFNTAGAQERKNLATEIISLDPSLKLVWNTASKGMAILDRLHGSDEANTNRAILSLMYAEMGEAPDVFEAANQASGYLMTPETAAALFDFQKDIANYGDKTYSSKSDYETMLNNTYNSTLNAIASQMQGVNIQELLYKDLLKVTLDATYSYYKQGLWK